nr:unnamed protein product [Callosobruchus analis]
MCCPYECPPQMCSSNESIEEDCNYDPCCQCSACQEPCPPPCCPPRPCTPFPCPPRRVPRPCNPCCPPPRCPPRPCSPPPPRCAPRPCNPCLPPPCCPCKVKGKFGLAYIVETPKNRCETPLGWQIEFEDTPSKIASSCKKMMQWVNCPPLGECGTEAVMSGYPKKCARALACNPNQCCYEDTPLPPCDCESEPKCCCRPKPQKCCKPRPQRRKPCCCPPPQQSCCCGKQERKRYEEPGCSCCKKRGSNTPRGDDDSLDYVPDKEVHHKSKNGSRDNQKKEQHKDSKYVQHDQTHNGKDEESAVSKDG